MKKIYLLLTSLFLSMSLLADEGMWTLINLPESNWEMMHELGLELTAEQVYNEQQASLKDAIVQFDGGCTGVTVSDKGLIFTNHHCGYGAIQSQSSVEHDYLRDGFAAQDFKDELPIAGMNVRYLKSTKDVTEAIIGSLGDISESDRRKAISENIKGLEQKMTLELENKYDVEISSYYSGNKYYANVYETFTDIRLVFAPPSSIGKFGGDTDNWMWPRHTGDFSVFRVYANKDNQPAEYSEENIPYTPLYVAPVSLDGYEPDSYTMIMGYPGSTNRYLSSWGVKQRMESSNAPRIEVRGIRQGIWMDAMLKDDATRIKYSSKYMRSSNYWKNSIGMNRGIENMGVIAQKEKTEKDFANWLEKNPNKKATYGNTIQLIKEGYQASYDAQKVMTYLREAGSNTEIVQMAELVAYINVIPEENLGDLLEYLFSNYKDYDPALDQKVLAAMLQIMKERVPSQHLPSIFNEIDKKFKGDYTKYSEYLFKKSVVPYPEKLKETLSDAKKLSKIGKDPAIVLAMSLAEVEDALNKEFSQYKEMIQKGERLFMAGLIEMNPEKSYYPDANFSLRITYGTVGGYVPYDGAWYNYYTTPKGLFEKYKKDDPEFNLQPEIIKLMNEGNFGRYANKDGIMNINFLSNNDITGGNSGSPIFDGKGRVIGLAFDGNWEAMSGDIAFENQVQRTINVDIRYVLYIMEKWGKSQRLIDELSIQ
ncbi:S46 family peptidase [Bacteroidales bacterium OttesenSCG-928-I14]|nr:S46 family peptidase [Bacteroidales bacterium OttesenSCG-928-I14]